MLADVLSCTVNTLFFVKRAGRMRHTVFTLCKNIAWRYSNHTGRSTAARALSGALGDADGRDEALILCDDILPEMCRVVCVPSLLWGQRRQPDPSSFTLQHPRPPPLTPAASPRLSP